MALGSLSEVLFNSFKAIFKVEDEYLVPLYIGYEYEEGSVLILVTKNNELDVWNRSNGAFSRIYDTGNILTPYIIYQLEFLHGIPIKQ